MNILIGESGLNVTRPAGEALSFVPENLRGKHGTEVPNAQKKIKSKPKIVMSRPVQVILIAFNSLKTVIFKELRIIRCNENILFSI